MKLTELNPKYGSSNIQRTHIIFDCPVCRSHKIAVPFVGEKKWEKAGVDFETTTMAPSIAHDNGAGCKSHFFIRKGEIVMA